MSIKLNAIAQRILSDRLESYAETITSQASAEGKDISVETDLSEDGGSISLSGNQLLQAHYGDRENASSGFVSSLLEGLTQQRRSV
nr:hypothetical protein [uncultured Cohaesibacter sp.]